MQISSLPKKSKKPQIKRLLLLTNKSGRILEILKARWRTMSQWKKRIVMLLRAALPILLTALNCPSCQLTARLTTIVRWKVKTSTGCSRSRRAPVATLCLASTTWKMTWSCRWTSMPLLTMKLLVFHPPDTMTKWRTVSLRRSSKK